MDRSIFIKNKNLKKGIVFFYLISLILYILYSGGIFSFSNLCDFYKYHESTLLGKFQGFVFFIYSFIISFLIINDKYYRIIFYIIFPVIASMIITVSIKKKRIEDLHRDKFIVTKAVVINNYSTSFLRILNVRYQINEKKMKGSIKVLEKVDNVKSGDTILVKYSSDCSYIIGLYSSFPNNMLLKKCKNDCFLIDSILIPIKKE